MGDPTKCIGDFVIWLWPSQTSNKLEVLKLNHWLGSIFAIFYQPGEVIRELLFGSCVTKYRWFFFRFKSASVAGDGKVSLHKRTAPSHLIQDK